METVVNRYTEEEKRNHVEKIKSLGVSQAEYRKMTGIARTTLSSWMKKYGGNGEESSRTDARKEGFVRIGSKPQGISNGDMVMEYRGARFSFPASSLALVLRTLRSVSG